MKSTNDPSCKNFPKSSLIQLHGLWPNYENGYPQGSCGSAECPLQNDSLGKYCKYPKPQGLYDSARWSQLNDYMAGREKCLERHEWVKHGTCSPMAPPEYFGWSLEKTRQISTALAIKADRRISRQAFNGIVAQRIPDLDGSVRLSCNGKYVSGIYVLYEWGEKPGKPIKTSSGKNSFGNCSNTFVFPSRPKM
jgi:ribonuclease T2